MSPKAKEALQLVNTSLQEFNIDWMTRDAATIDILPISKKKRFEPRDHIYDNYNLTLGREGNEIGRANVESWDEAVGEESIRIVTVEDLYLKNSYYNHSAYLALLRETAKAEPEAVRIEGMPTNDMAAVTLDLDTFGLLPEGWAARYFRVEDSELIELQYPIEVYENIRDGQQVYHTIERITEN